LQAQLIPTPTGWTLRSSSPHPIELQVRLKPEDKAPFSAQDMLVFPGSHQITPSKHSAFQKAIEQLQPGQSFSFGRQGDIPIFCQDTGVSREHGRIGKDSQGALYLENLSKNGLLQLAAIAPKSSRSLASGEITFRMNQSTVAAPPLKDPPPQS
jgi:FHA domain